MEREPKREKGSVRFERGSRLEEEGSRERGLYGCEKGSGFEFPAGEGRAGGPAGRKTEGAVSRAGQGTASWKLPQCSLLPAFQQTRGREGRGKRGRDWSALTRNLLSTLIHRRDSSHPLPPLFTHVSPFTSSSLHTLRSSLLPTFYSPLSPHSLLGREFLLPSTRRAGRSTGSIHSSERVKSPVHGKQCSSCAGRRKTAGARDGATRTATCAFGPGIRD